MRKADNARRDLLWKLLGALPSRKRAISASTIRTDEHKHYFLETLALDLNGLEEVPAYFARPKNGRKKMPVVLYNHAHGGDYVIGKDEFIKERKGLQHLPYAGALARLGFSGLCIDHWCFGGRRGKSESATFKEMLWNGRVLWGMMVYDSIRALDYLSTRDDVDMNRVGTLGISMGSTMAWWLAALDPRVKVCIDICCLTDFRSLIETNGLDRHGIYYYVPGLLRYFSTADINELIVPRAHLSLAGTRDGLTPAKGLDVIDARLRKAYEKAGFPGNWRLSRYRVGHRETREMRQEIISFLRKKI